MEVKVGDKVKAIFNKFGRHTVEGDVWEVGPDEGGLPGIWVSIKVTGGDMKDRYVSFMANGKFNVMVPIKDVKEVIA